MENKKPNNIQLFQEQKVRTHWDEDKEKWYLSVQDVVQVLSESKDVKQYIKKMRSRDAELNFNWGTICTPFPMLAEASTTEISKEKKPKGLTENKDIARKGVNAAKKARLEIEKQTGKSIVTSKNAKFLLDSSDNKKIDKE